MSDKPPNNFGDGLDALRDGIAAAGIKPYSPSFARPHALLDKSTRRSVATKGVASAEELQADIDAILRKRRQEFGAAPTTVEALMWSLRERGVAALAEPDTQRRLSELHEHQMIEVAERLQKLRPHIATAWGAEEIKKLFETKASLHV